MDELFDCKKCTLCKTVKPFSAFHKASNIKDGYKGQCKDCRLIEKRIYKLKNKEREIKIQKEWRKNNPHKIKEYNVKYKVRIDNYYEENCEKVKNRMKDYHQTPKGRSVNNLSGRKYRALRVTTDDCTITLTSLERLKHLQDDKCYHCGTELLYDVPFEVHLDHYIPISKGGLHSIKNVVWSCKTCNLKKSATILEGGLDEI